MGGAWQCGGGAARSGGGAGCLNWESATCMLAAFPAVVQSVTLTREKRPYGGKNTLLVVGVGVWLHVSLWC